MGDCRPDERMREMYNDHQVTARNLVAKMVATLTTEERAIAGALFDSRDETFMYELMHHLARSR